MELQYIIIITSIYRKVECYIHVCTNLVARSPSHNPIPKSVPILMEWEPVPQY